MRVTTWNRPRAEIQDSLDLLAPLRADLVALQECRRPDGESPAVTWRGEHEQQGAAVVRNSEAFSIEPIEIPSLHPTVVPVVVQAPEPFVFVGGLDPSALQRGGLGGDDGLQDGGGRPRPAHGGRR